MWLRQPINYLYCWGGQPWAAGIQELNRGAVWRVSSDSVKDVAAARTLTMQTPVTTEHPWIILFPHETVTLFQDPNKLTLHVCISPL